MTRMTELAAAATEALEDGRDPLHMEFLAEHDVTFDECFALAERMALGLRIVDMVISADPDVIAGALTGAHTTAAYKALNAALTRLTERT